MISLSSFLALIGFIGVCALTALTGSFFRPGVWYEQLTKPNWRPPNSVFAPVWAILYLMIALSGWLVWLQTDFSVAAAPLAIYFLQLTLNASWTPAFFGLRRIDLGLLTIVLLWLSILATVVVFFPISAVAAFLLIPYLAWVTFAAALNFSIWRRNPPCGLCDS